MSDERTGKAASLSVADAQKALSHPHTSAGGVVAMGNTTRSAIEDFRRDTRVRWSILIPTVPSRAQKLQRVLDQLNKQRGVLFNVPASAYDPAHPEYEPHEIDVFWFCPIQVLVHSTAPATGKDNTVGEKRNLLLDNAEGEFISFVDDDDVLAEDYVSSIYEAITSTPLDLVTFDTMVFGHGKPLPCVYGLGFRENENRKDRYERLPNHLMVWRRTFCVRFEHLSYGEDSRWAEAMLARHIPFRWHRIDRVLYEYRHDRHDSVCTQTVK